VPATKSRLGERLPGVAQVARTCWLIDDEAVAREHHAATRFARLRGIVARPCRDVESIPAQLGKPTLIAIRAAALYRLSGDARQHLAGLVGQGSTLYVRGLPEPGDALDLTPFAQSSVRIAGQIRAAAYRFTASAMLPAVLAREEAKDCPFQSCGAQQLPSEAEELLMLRDEEGQEFAVIFAVRHGNGQVICDLHPQDEDCGGTPLVDRLADPQTRHKDIGALLAVDCAVGTDPQRLPFFNLTIDDRPVDFDHFNTERVKALLRHIEEVCPGAHTDFAWTPWHTRPSRRYLDVMKKFPTGFVWHGFHRHVDHYAIEYPAAEIAMGQRLVSEIEKRFGVRLQRIMIFPFERSTMAQLRLLHEAGFLACVGEPGDWHNFDAHLPRYLHCSLPSIIDPSSGFAVLYRYRVSALSRDRMLAMASLGVPIIAYAHPDDLRLRRLSRLWHREGNLDHFDPVLTFAASKGLPSRSLEDIVREVEAASAIHVS